MSAIMLTAFLLARIAEDEAVANACPPWPWHVSTLNDETAGHDEFTYAAETVSAADGIAVATPHALSGGQTRAVRDHIVRNDPARVLAECEAKRRIVAIATDQIRLAADDIGGWDNWRDMAEQTLRAVAAIYADHPDYHDEWRV